MKNLLMMLLLAVSLSTVAVGCADEVNAETDDINTDNEPDPEEGAAGMGDPEPDPVTDVDECVAACNNDACAAACSD
jgi:hypothetical protein